MYNWLHHPLKLLLSAFCCVSIQASIDGFMLRLICDVGCDLPNIDATKSLSSAHDDRSVDHFTMYWFTSQTTKYVIL